MSLRTLIERGFVRSGQWSLDPSRSLRLSGSLPDNPGVYAFVLDCVFQYVGVASKSLARRLYHYTRPGSSQRTNLRLNSMIRSKLADQGKIDVYTAQPPDLEWMGWKISGPEGLEAGIIKNFQLPWNLRGAVVGVDHATQPATGGTVPSQTTPTEMQHKAEHSERHVETSSAGSERRRSSHGNKYRPLCEFLEKSGQEKVSMTFNQIQELVGKLPKSASLHRAWWANHEGNSQAKGWMPARYLAEPNPAHRSVVFRKFSY